MGRVADTRYREEQAMRRFIAFYSWGEDGCILWTGSTLRDGYGSFTDEHGKTVPAHRWAYAKAKMRKLRPHEVVRHTCDQPLCVNTMHLVLGTQADNIADKMAKGRQARGAQSRRPTDTSVVDEDVVRDIRSLAGDGLLTGKMIGELYGISQANVSDISRRKVWAWVA